MSFKAILGAKYRKNSVHGAMQKIFTWGGVKDYDGRTWLYVENNEVYLRENGANAYVVFKDNKPYAHLL